HFAAWCGPAGRPDHVRIPLDRGKGELLSTWAGPAYTRFGVPRKSGTAKTIAREQDGRLWGGCVTGWNGNAERLLAPTATADPARFPSSPFSRRQRDRPRDAAIVLGTALLIGCGVSALIWHGQVTALIAAFASSVVTAVIFAWLSARSLGRQRLAAARL